MENTNTKKIKNAVMYSGGSTIIATSIIRILGYYVPIPTEISLELVGILTVIVNTVAVFLKNHLQKVIK